MGPSITSASILATSYQERTRGCLAIGRLVLNRVAPPAFKRGKLSAWILLDRPRLTLRTVLPALAFLRCSTATIRHAIHLNGIRRIGVPALLRAREGLAHER